MPLKLVQYTAQAFAAHASGRRRRHRPRPRRHPHDAPNRAAALYGARLGLDMRLDRTEPKWGSRLMFFRCGDLIVEIVHDLKDEPSDAPDRLWGLSWRVADADAAHARLKAAGFDVSDVRAGRKPGTRVFTVRDSTLGVPTLMVEPSARSLRIRAISRVAVVRLPPFDLAAMTADLRRPRPPTITSRTALLPATNT